MSRFQDDHEAVSQIMGFLVAGGVFLVAVGAVLLNTQMAGGDGEPVRNAGQEASAESLADLLMQSQGLGWADGADELDRLGLLADNGSGLDLARMGALRGAVAASDPDN